MSRPGTLRSLAVLLGVLLATVAAVLEAPPSADAQADTLRLELIDQVLAFGPGEDIRLSYRVTGDLRAAQVLVPDPPPTPTPEEGDDPDAGDDPEAGDTDAAPEDADLDEDSENPENPVPELFVRVINYPALQSSDSVAAVVGSSVDREAFGNAIDGVEIDRARDLLVEDPDGNGAELELSVPTDFGESEADHLQFDEQGIFPIRVELVIDDGTGRRPLATAGTVVQRLAEGGSRVPPIDLSLIGAVAEPPADASTEDLDASRREVRDFGAFADDIVSPITLALPPRTVESIDATALDRLSSSLVDDELASLPDAPVNVSSAAAVDRADTFARQLLVGEEVLIDALPTTPVRRDVWIAREPLSGAGAAALRDLGVRYVTMTRELYRSTVSDDLPATDLFVDIALPDGGTLPLLVVDEVGDHLTTLTATGVDSPTEHAVVTLGELLLAPRTDDPQARRSRIVAAPDLGPLDVDLVAELERLAPTTPDVRLTIASSLTGLTDRQLDAGVPVSVELPDDAGPSLEARVQQLDDVALVLASVATMLPDDDMRPDAWIGELDGLVSTEYSDEDVDETVSRLLAEADRLKDAVALPEPFTFTLTGRNGEIEIPLVNRIDEPVRVVLGLSSPKLEFPDGDVEVLLAPNSETRVVVPVSARANGTSAVSVEVRTPLGEVLGEPVRLTSRVTALTGLGQLLTATLVLVLIAWWYAHWRSRRRAAVLEGTERHPSGAGSIVEP